MRLWHYSSFVLVFLGIVLLLQLNLPPEKSPSTQPISCRFLLPGGNAASPYSEPVTTQFLINQAVSEGRISQEERLIYFSYAIREYSSLPIEFRGNFSWEPADEVTELTNTVMHTEKMCQLTPCIQSELRRVMGRGVTCNPN